MSLNRANPKAVRALFNKQKTRAFTLIELLVVVVIIGILVGVGIAQYNSNIDKAKRAKVSASITQQKKSYLASCVGKDKKNCPLDLQAFAATSTRIMSDCEDVCIQNNRRLATIEELFWYAETGESLCSWMWVYSDNKANSFSQGFPMYMNKTVGGCGVLNSGDIPRVFSYKKNGTYGDVYNSSKLVDESFRFKIDRPTGGGHSCGCINY